MKEQDKIERAICAAEVCAKDLTRPQRERIMLAARTLRDLQASLAKFDKLAN